MPVVVSPLFSMQARGTLGATLVYMRRSGADIVRIWVKPENPNTVNQQTIRSFFSNAVTAWQAESAQTKAAWDAYATEMGVPATYGFNYYVGSYVKYCIDHSGVEPTSPYLPPA